MKYPRNWMTDESVADFADVKAARAIDRGATFRSYIVEGLPAQ
jgi:hypothetical protein